MPKVPFYALKICINDILFITLQHQMAEEWSFDNNIH